MNKIFNLTSTFKAAESDDGSVMIRGMASTADFDRAGDTISAEAWTKGGLQNFEKNPIILFNHDYDRPIGRATGMKAGPNGLELECKISKNAPGNVAELVKDGVLGAFSVGFKVKDADYLKETDGLMIKDAELFEVSVVSVPCNQEATFSLAKSFDSSEEYDEFKKTFTNRVDLAGQSLAKDEDTSSNIASDHTPKSAELNSADQEIKMDKNQIDLEAFAKQVADETAAKIAMKQAEQKAAEKAAQDADAAKAAEAESIKSSIETGVKTGVEALEADMQKELTAKDANMAEVLEKYESALKEHSAEMEAMRNSKRDFSGRGQKSGDLSSFGKDFMNASMVAKVLGKSFEDTATGQAALQKANVAFTGAVEQTAIDKFEENVRLNYRAANFFDELAVTAQKTVIPVGLEPTQAAQDTGGISTDTNRIANGGGTDGEYELGNVTLTTNRLIAGQFIDNNTDEVMVATVMPIIMNALAHSQAKKVEKTIVDILDGAAATDEGNELVMGRKDLLAGRTALGNLGVDPSRLVYILSVAAYNELLQEGEFDEFQQVGMDNAARITGTIANFYGSPVVVSDQLGVDGDAVVANRDAFIIPRLGGLQVETDYEVANQRTAIVSSQSMGFSQIISGVGSSLVRPAA